MDIQTDTTTVVIDIREHANVLIQALNAPTFAFVGEDFTIEYDAVNQGGEQMCYCKVLDATGTELDRWEDTISSGGTQHIQHTLNIPNTGNITLTIEVGYVE